MALLRKAFRKGKLMFYGALARLHRSGEFEAVLNQLITTSFGGPELVLRYLANYTHRVAISNHRILSVGDGEVTFRWKDYAHGNKKKR